MKINQAVWAKVHIDWDLPLPRVKLDRRLNKMVEDPVTEETFENVKLYYECAFEQRQIYTLRIANGDQNMLLTRAKLLKMTPWSATFEVYWWGAGEHEDSKARYRRWRRKHKQKKSDLPGKFDAMVRGIVTCEF